MHKGFDCYDTPTAFVLARAARLGYEVCIQYYGSPTSPKVTTAEEVKRISDAGLKLFMAFERNQGRPLLGRQAGLEDGKLAIAQAHVAGQPQGTTIAFAVDTDADTSQQSIRNALMAYFTGVRDAMDGTYRLGAYGGGDVLTLLSGIGLIEVKWLAGAMGWRGSHDYDKAALWDLKQYPTTPQPNDLGIEYDPNDITDLDKIGAWPLAARPPAPPPPSPGTGPIDLFDLQSKLKTEGFYNGVVDGIVVNGGETVRGLVAYSVIHRPPKE